MYDSRQDAIQYRASPQIGPGEGFREDKQRSYPAENTGYASLPDKSRSAIAIILAAHLILLVVDDGGGIDVGHPDIPAIFHF